jgi:glutamine amidotransferase
VHSYNFQVTNSKNLLATTDHGEKITAAIIKDNIFGVQFHPEKSQLPGIELIKNFINLNY